MKATKEQAVEEKMVAMIRLPEREAVVSADVDVVVVGGGPAGITSAIAAARNGARTMILEQRGCGKLL